MTNLDSRRVDFIKAIGMGWGDPDSTVVEPGDPIVVHWDQFDEPGPPGTNTGPVYITRMRTTITHEIGERREYPYWNKP